jgi:hypothetical protein
VVEIQVSRENRKLQKSNQNREGVIMWSIAVEDLGWMITLSQPEMLESTSAHIHIHTHVPNTERERDRMYMGRTDNMNTLIPQPAADTALIKHGEVHGNTPHITPSTVIIEQGESDFSKAQAPQRLGQGIARGQF